MPSTPKYSRSPSPESLCRGSDVSEAPYLTHVVTHHGRITLVPPQNQGRLRKDKKPHQTRSTQLQPPLQEYVHVLPARSASPSSLSFSRPQKLRKSQETFRNVVSNAQSSSRGSFTQSPAQGHSSMRLEQPGAPISSLPLPPSYDFVRSDATRAISNDFIAHPSSPSTSSDEFEDITETDLESQWELDRIVGLTLEERVRREWLRQQAAINASQPAASGSQGLKSTETGNKTSRALNDSGAPPKPSPKDSVLRRPAKPLLALPLPSTSKLSSQTVASEDASPVLSDALINSSKSSLGDWDLLESPLSSRSFQRHRTSRLLGASGPPLQEQSVSDVESFSSVSSSSSQEERRWEKNCVVNGHESTDYTASGDHSDKSDEYEAGPSSSEAGEHKILVVRDGKRLSLIHNRPLPMPPVPSTSTQAVQTSEASISGMPSESPTPTPASSGVVYSGASSSVRDCITKFETMHGRPVPPPPAAFLKTRVRRKPPPPPSPLVPPDVSKERCVSNKTIDIRHHGLSEAASVSPTVGTHGDDIGSAQPRDIPRAISLSPQQLELGGQTPLLPSNSGLSHEYGDNPTSSSGPEQPEQPRHSSENVHHIVIHIDTASSAMERHHSLDPQDPTQGSTHETPNIGVSPPTEDRSENTTLSQYTDFDVLLSRLDDETSSGNRYEDLLLISDILGPARPESPTLPLTQTRGILGELPLGKIEVVRRRKLQDGRVKLKLSLLGVMVDRCQVCLSQFKDAEWAILLPCLHSYHSTCLQSWLTRSHTCPLCRISLDESD